MYLGNDFKTGVKYQYASSSVRSCTCFSGKTYSRFVTDTVSNFNEHLFVFNKSTGY